MWDNPVQVDWRVGSIELKDNLEQLGVKVKVAGPGKRDELSAGDYCFEGYGPRGLCMVGIERKTLHDIMDCMRSSRFVDKQLTGMLDIYDFSYLVVEGLHRANPHTGILEYGRFQRDGRIWWQELLLGKTRYMWQDLDGYLTTIEQSKIKLLRTNDDWQTARTIKGKHHWFTKCQWHEHQSLRGLYSPPDQFMALEEKDSLVRRWAKELDGIGVEKSMACMGKFRTALDMAQATREEWAEIPGVGPTISRNVWNQIRGFEGKRK
jgi:ERCC4-type nuclease